jgi:hypothetical protein
VTKQVKPEQRHRRLLLPTVSRDTLNNALDIALNSEPISKCFAFLKLAFEVCLYIQIINYYIINYLKCKLLTKTSLLLFARASSKKKPAAAGREKSL